jgi:hypothetical protein
LVKMSGVTIPEKKSAQYEGLSIRGKKKKAWARAYNPSGGYSSESKTSPPLLLAAYSGSLESVEWLFSDAPIRLYKEYVEANKQFAEVEAFSKLPGGTERAISQWLDTKSKFTTFKLNRTNEEQIKRRFTVQFYPSSTPTRMTLRMLPNIKHGVIGSKNLSHI